MNSELAYGTVGWVDDGGEYYEISSPGDDGNILVRVTLFKNRDLTLPTLDTQAQGTQLLCSLSSSFIQVPPRGTRVLVAIPETFGKNGGATIIAAMNPNPALVGNIKAGDTSVAASQGVARLQMKSDGRVALATKDNNKIAGNDVFFQVSPTEERFWSPWGSRLHDATGFHLRTWHGAKIDFGGLGLPSPFSAVSSTGMISADMINIDAAILSLGRDAGFTQAVVQALPLQTILTAVATALNDISNWMAQLNILLPTGANGGGTVGYAGLLTPPYSTAVAAVSSAVTAAATLLATVNTAAASGGCATNTTVA